MVLASYPGFPSQILSCNFGETPGKKAGMMSHECCHDNTSTGFRGQQHHKTFVTVSRQAGNREEDDCESRNAGTWKKNAEWNTNVKFCVTWSTKIYKIALGSQLFVYVSSKCQRWLPLFLISCELFPFQSFCTPTSTVIPRKTQYCLTILEDTQSYQNFQ